MKVTEVNVEILTPEIAEQLKKASDEGKFGKEKIESAKKFLEKGFLEKLNSFLKDEKTQ
jgi:predicted Zn-dependent peptidase